MPLKKLELCLCICWQFLPFSLYTWPEIESSRNSPETISFLVFISLIVFIPLVIEKITILTASILRVLISIPMAGLSFFFVMLFVEMLQNPTNNFNVVQKYSISLFLLSAVMLNLLLLFRGAKGIKNGLYALKSN